MTDTPRISIITPSLNQGAYLERTVRSVVDQGYPDLEYIVVDGGSTDESVSILERYDDRIAYWVSESDSGQAHAINKGLARATGSIVAYINSDDYYLPGAFAEIARTLCGPRVSWVAGSCRYEYPDGTIEILFRPAAADRFAAVVDSRGLVRATGVVVLATRGVRDPRRRPGGPLVRLRHRVRPKAGAGRGHAARDRRDGAR